MPKALFDIPLKHIDGSEGDLSPYQGKVLLIVNVASKCGLTTQYSGLEALYQSRRDAGLEVLGFPANDFKEQEPGSDAEISQFCSLNYDVHFPLFSKISVRGENRHLLYGELTAAQPSAIGDGPFREKLKGYGTQARCCGTSRNSWSTARGKWSHALRLTSPRMINDW